jgi:ADP-heptose:LPS heptosyltransferase
MLTTRPPRTGSATFAPRSPSAVSHIAIFQALNLGDLLCATPAARALRQRYPDAEITWIGRPEMQLLIERLTSVDRFQPFPGFAGIAESPTDEEPSAFWQQFGLALQFHGSGEISNGFVASLCAKHSVGYGPRGDGRLSTVLPWVEDEPEPRRWLRLAAAAGARSDDWSLEMPITPAERTQALSLLRYSAWGRLIGLHVGASEQARCWPAARFATLGDLLAARYRATIVLTGSRDDRPLTREVGNLMRHAPLDVAGETSLGAFGAVVASLDLLVSNDTGASHVAAATGTPSVVLFGPTRPGRWAPLDRVRHRVVDAMQVCPTAADGTAALRQLPIDAVLEVCDAAMEAPRTLRQAAAEVLPWAG